LSDFCAVAITVNPLTVPADTLAPVAPNDVSSDTTAADVAASAGGGTTHGTDAETKDETPALHGGAEVAPLGGAR